MGTPGYIAPEQASYDADRVVDARADVYSLGAILYKLLTSQTPVVLDECDILAAIEQIHTGDITLPRVHDRSIPADLEAICMKCLSRNRDDRYNDAHELAEDVSRFLDGEPVSASPITRKRRLYNWARSKPGLASTLVGISTFYIFHLICVYVLQLYDLSIPTYRNFHYASTAIAACWLVGAIHFQRQLIRSSTSQWPLIGWVTMEPVLLTTLLLLIRAPVTSPLCVIYLLLIAISVLRFKPLIVVVATIACIASYLFIGWRSLMNSDEVAITDIVPMVLSMVCIGLIQFFALRRSRTVFKHLGHRP